MLFRSIKTISGVKGAEVTIVNGSEDYALSTDKVEASASVKLNLITGLSLTSKQVDGIVQLVSHSVSNLKAENVAVLDSNGTPLNDTSDAGDIASQLVIVNQVENKIKNKVLSVLGPVYGESNVQVAVGATIDFSQQKTNTTSYTGANDGLGVPENNATTTTGGSTSSAASGTPGITYSPDQGTTTGGSEGQNSSATNYLVNSINQEITSKGGTLTGLTVAVLLNSADELAATARPADVQRTVAYAIGTTDTAVVSVQQTRFAPQTAEAAPSGIFGNKLVLAAIGAGLLLLILLFVFMLLRRKKKRAAIAEAEIMGLAPAAVGAGIQQPGLPGQVEDMPAIMSIEETIEQSESNSIKKQIEDFTEKKPELVAQLLRSWIND